MRIDLPFIVEIPNPYRFIYWYHMHLKQVSFYDCGVFVSYNDYAASCKNMLYKKKGFWLYSKSIKT